MEITEEELNKKIADAVAEAKKGLLTQDQFNEAISKRISEVNDKHKKELEEKEKTAKMTAEEKQKHEFEQLTKERDELKSSLQAKEHKEKMLSLMADKKLDSSMYDMFSGIQDLEQAGVMMDKFNETVSNRVNAEIDGKIKPNVPHNNPNDKKDAFEQGFDEN
jgi:hypothetical protein